MTTIRCWGRFKVVRNYKTYLPHGRIVSIFCRLHEVLESLKRTCGSTMHQIKNLYPSPKRRWEEWALTRLGMESITSFSYIVVVMEQLVKKIKSICSIQKTPKRLNSISRWNWGSSLKIRISFAAYSQYTFSTYAVRLQFSCGDVAVRVAVPVAVCVAVL